MPIYEYVCRTCTKRSSILVLNIHNPPPPACRHCGSPAVNRLFSRFAAPKSEEARLESLADPSNLGGLDEQDPQSVARFMKKMEQELGEDVSDDMEAMLTQEGKAEDLMEGSDSQ